MKLKIVDTAHHRNGICGAPFTSSCSRTQARRAAVRSASSSTNRTIVPSSTWPSSPPETSLSRPIHGEGISTNPTCAKR